MSSICSIDYLLNADSTHANIYSILLYGHQHGFKYWSYTWDELDERRILNLEEAVDHIFSLFFEKAECGPCIFVQLDSEADVLFRFGLEKNKSFSFHISSFGADCKKTEDGRIDLSYYVPFFLKICKDFTVIKIEAFFLEDLG